MERGLTWSLVQLEVSTFTTTLAYDRAGLGWSDPSPLPRTAGNMVDELRASLEALALEPPYVLVGQSFGALVTRLFAYRYPKDVAGMVLVDPAHEDQMARFPQPVRDAQPTLLRMQVEHLQGLRERLAKGDPVDAAVLGLPDKLPEEAIAGYGAVAASDVSHVDTMIAELEALERTQAEVRAARDRERAPQQIPAVVLSHGQPAPLPPIVQGGADTASAYEDVWQQTQVELSELSSRGRRFVAGASGHMIHHDEHALVIRAIRDIVDSVRKESDR